MIAGIAIFWIGCTFWLRTDAGVPNWLLPLALVAGTTLTLFVRPTERSAHTPRHPDKTWLLVAVLGAFAAVLATATFLLGHGATSTGSRHWDGAASFDAKVHWLTGTPTLQQPFFADPAVFHHSPDYPLLLPLLTAMFDRNALGLGRLAMPALYLLLCLLAGGALMRHTQRVVVGVLGAAALAVTPMLLRPGGGAADSGYSELPMLLATTVVMIGLLDRSFARIACGALLAIASKPEGLPYCAVAIAACFATRERRSMWAAWLGCSLALLLWQPVRETLLHVDPGESSMAPLLAAIAILAVALFAADVLAGTRTWLRIAFVCLPIAVGVALLPWLAAHASGDSALAVYLRRGADVLPGLANIPAYLAALVDYSMLRLRYGLVPLLALLTLAAMFKLRIPRAANAGHVFVLLGVAATAVPFVLSPEPDLGHHLRSSLPRLALHWIGPLTLLTTIWLDRVLAFSPNAGPAVRT
ncbi:MAG: hypothetical protein AB8H80_04365 [Planctomycetota bacterium]